MRLRMIERLATNRTVAVIFLLLLSVIVFSNTLGIPFLFDDIPLIVDNPLIKDLEYVFDADAGKNFADHGVFRRRIAGFATFALNYRIHGLEPAGYHVFNIVAHTINAVLVFLLVMAVFRSPALENSRLRENRNVLGLFLAAAFLVHTGNSAAVNFVYQRLSVLSASCFLGSLLFYIHARTAFDCARKVKGVLFYLAVLVITITGYFIKETTIMIPVILGVYELLFFRGKMQKRLLYVVPLFLSMLIPLASLLSTGLNIKTLLLGLQSGDSPDLLTSQFERDFHDVRQSRLHYYMTQMWVLLYYVKIQIMPAGQSFALPYRLADSFRNPYVFGSLLAHVSMVTVALYCLVRARKLDASYLLVTFGVFWLYATVAVEAVVVLPLMTVEYRSYVLGIGVLMALGVLIANAYVNLAERGKGRPVLMFVVLMLLVLSSWTMIRNAMWNNPLEFWQDMVDKSPRNELAQLAVGNMYANRDQMDRAITYYKAALQEDPRYVAANLNMAKVLKAKGRTSESVSYFINAIAGDDRKVEAYVELAEAYYEMGMLNEARQIYEKLFMMNFGMEKALQMSRAANNLAFIYERQNNLKQAAYYYGKAVSYDPRYDLALFNLANVHYAMNQPGKARELYERVISLKPDSVEAHNNLGYVMLEQGLVDEAIVHFKEALSYEPGFSAAMKNLGLAYLKAGRPDEALQVLTRAEKELPGDEELKQALRQAKARM